MTRGVREMKKFVVCFMALTMLAGCPLLAQLFDARATLVVNNQSTSAAIDEVRLKGPNDGSFGPNVLETSITVGSSASLNIDVPATSQNGQVSNSTADFEVMVVYCCAIDSFGNMMSDAQTVTLIEGESTSATFGDECVIGSCP